jgi:hypothetical protein
LERELIERRRKNQDTVREYSLKLLDSESFEQMCLKCYEFLSCLDYEIAFAQVFLRVNDYYVLYSPNVLDRIKTYQDSHAFVRKLTKGKRVLFSETDEHRD